MLIPTLPLLHPTSLEAIQTKSPQTIFVHLLHHVHGQAEARLDVLAEVAFVAVVVGWGPEGLELGDEGAEGGGPWEWVSGVGLWDEVEGWYCGGLPDEGRPDEVVSECAEEDDRWRRLY